ncbi:PREDICTED: protein FAM163B [Charadrius vociferus]|uniref:protein FAM163B n=1 Tax=Charadrius vociferus TaxID=50402 RepID=UPI0005215CA1|nr:PREDICTED: protein FAM163B [Charadrius vociferus]
MTAGTVVITGGILATVILLCIIAVLCYCRLQVSRPGCPGCVPYEPPTFFLQEPPEELHNGGDRVSYKTVSQEDLDLPVSVANLQALNPNRLSAMREAFSRSRSISTDV